MMKERRVDLQLKRQQQQEERKERRRKEAQGLWRS
jgi:hypothetical protein